jgi:hypothetical protein
VGIATTSAGDVAIRAPGGTAGEREVPPTDVPLRAMPQLVPHEGELGHWLLSMTTAHAYFPRGVPSRVGDGITTWQQEQEHADHEIVIRIWLAEPSDLEGVFFQFRDQDLVPDGPVDAYAARFAARVEEQVGRSAAYHAERRSIEASERAFCEQHPNEARCVSARIQRPSQPPPPPLVETPPAAPSPDVDWVPGFWRFDPDALDYVWIAGTFVVRPPPPESAPQVVARAPEPPPPMPPPPAPEPSAAREIDVEISAPPPPRTEVIPAPPRVPGVVWVAGAWRLEGRAWVWVPGAWQLPPSAGARPVAPTVRERSGVRIYVPGGWIDIR